MDISEKKYKPGQKLEIEIETLQELVEIETC